MLLQITRRKEVILTETFTKCQKRGTEANSFAAAHADVLAGQQPLCTEDVIPQLPKLACWRFPVLSACVTQSGMAIYNLEKPCLSLIQCLSQTDGIKNNGKIPYLWFFLKLGPYEYYYFCALLLFILLVLILERATASFHFHPKQHDKFLHCF